MKAALLKWIQTTVHTAKTKLETAVPVAANRLQYLFGYRNPFAPADKESEQGRLMGMYLAYANTKSPRTAPRTVVSERHRGRPHVRERVSPFSR